jgi:hypothetical protein
MKVQKTRLSFVHKFMHPNLASARLPEDARRPASPAANQRPHQRGAASSTRLMLGPLLGEYDRAGGAAFVGDFDKLHPGPPPASTGDRSEFVTRTSQISVLSARRCQESTAGAVGNVEGRPGV